MSNKDTCTTYSQEFRQQKNFLACSLLKLFRSYFTTATNKTWCTIKNNTSVESLKKYLDITKINTELTLTLLQ